MSTRQRYRIFFFGIVCQSAGIALVVKSLLGTSPISSVPYILSLIVPFTFGQTTLAINLLFLAGQILLLRKKFHAVQLMQAPVTFVFAMLIDLFMSAFSGIAPDSYPWKMLLLLCGASMVSLGVALQVIANVLMLSGEGIVYAISHAFRIDFGKTKTGFDCFLVLTGTVLCLAYLPSIEGIREGTLVSALLTGYIARWFIHRLSYVDSTGNMRLKKFA